MHAGNCTDESAQYQASGGAQVIEPKNFVPGVWRDLNEFSYEALKFTGTLEFTFRVGQFESPGIPAEDENDLMIIAAAQGVTVVKLGRQPLI